MRPRIICGRRTIYRRDGQKLVPLYGFDLRFVIGFQQTGDTWYVTRRPRLWLKILWRIRRAIRCVAESV